MENAVYHPPTYFDNQYEDEWMTDPLTVAMVKDVDKADVVGVHLIQSPVLGPISVKEIYNKLRYELDIRRNITIIRGDSATGKTKLIHLLEQAAALGDASGVEVLCERPCRVLGGNDWEFVLPNLHEQIIFLD